MNFREKKIVEGLWQGGREKRDGQRENWYRWTNLNINHEKNIRVRTFKRK